MENRKRNGEALTDRNEVKRRTVLFTVFFVLLLVVAGPAFAQNKRSGDFGTILSAKFDADLTRQLAIEVEEELRFDHNCTQFDRWLNSVTLEVPFLHNRMHVGLSGGVIRRYNDRNFYESRARVGLDITYAETWRRFKFAYRSRLMTTFRDERVGDYRVNPKMYWRNRFQVTYQMPNSRFKYQFSTELHWLVNDPKASVIDNIRTVFTIDYRLSRRQHLGLFARMDNDIQVKAPVDRLYLGLEYHFKY